MEACANGCHARFGFNLYWSVAPANAAVIVGIGLERNRVPSPRFVHPGCTVTTNRIQVGEMLLHEERRVYLLYIQLGGGWCMSTARVFRSGNSQAVRLPKQFRLKSEEVEIFRRGDEIVLREKDGTMARAFDLLAGLPDDLVVVVREKDQPQKRKKL
jgi:antitoxin VapB